MRLARFFLLFATLALAVRAQTVRWEPSASGDPSEVQLVFENCAPDGDPRPPPVNGLSFTQAGTSSQTSIINFSMTKSVVLNYRLRGKVSGNQQIPAFSVKTDKGSLTVPAFTLSGARPAAEADIQAQLALSSSTFWAGEVIPLTFSLDVARRNFSQLAGPIEWNPTPLIIEEWTKPEATEVLAGGESRLRIISRSRAYAKAPGNARLQTASQLVNIATGTVNLGFPGFQQQRIEQVSVASPATEITVKPLPPSPSGFKGAVGQFKLDSKIVPTTTAIGDPITWTLELTGTGNWPEITTLPAREASRDFQVVQPQAKRSPADGKLFEVTLTEDVVLIPTKTGTYTLGPVSFTYFDPKSGTYKSATTAPVTVTVTPAAPPKFSVTPPPAAEKSAVEAAAKPVKLPPPPDAPGVIPREPLPGADPVLPPFSSISVLLAVLAAPFVLLLGFWFWLADRRARATDPSRPQREARRRLKAVVARLQAAGTQPERRLLQDWQRETALLWALDHAAPSSAALSDQGWKRLWDEADRALYGPADRLPEDWVIRAAGALEAHRVPAFAPTRVFLPRNLLPFLSVLILAATLPSLRADAPADAYRKGDFASAEKSWRKTRETHPSDWIARHNLALALAQQDRWAEAAAQATAAFVQNPRNEATRWNLPRAYEKAGYTPATLAPFLTHGPLHTLARAASPARWERILIFSSCGMAVSLGLLLHLAYGSRRRNLIPAALAGFSVCLLLAVGAIAGRNAYGMAADPRAALVWHPAILRSIPTEADTSQKTTPLSAGSVALESKTYLGWVQLSFENGQTGWVRKEDLVYLWR